MTADCSTASVQAVADTCGFSFMLLTGTAGVPPATRRSGAKIFPANPICSRFALIAGGTPAIPVRALLRSVDVTDRLPHKPLRRANRFFQRFPFS